MKQYKKYRNFCTKSGRLVVGGKSAEQNEELVKKFIGKENIIMHTAKPGSPFCVIKGRANRKDVKEAAVFCARYSHDWRDNKKNVLVHRFKGKHIYKNKKMKLGTFGIKKFKVIKVKKKDILKFIEEEKK
ncbi:unnamed protein product [marine sediment metagenome]|uniref:NFACT RNA-binding domain-containing protein n=1 Tax=marine sediment metagenome TaxID=412755 RepID=X0YGQ1_9ZZZZ